MLVPGNPLGISLPYAPEPRRDAILALHTVISEIAVIPGEVSDAGVGSAKLGWWRDQVVAGTSRHPALQALVDSAPEMLAAETADEWAGLFRGVSDILESPRFERFEALWAHCRDVGGAARGLEARLCGSETDPEIWRDLGAAGYLTRIVRDLRIDAAAHRWLVPLDVQAGFQVDRSQVAEDRPGPAFDGLVRDLIERGQRRLGEAEGRLSRAEAWRNRHALILAALDTRLARRLYRRPQRILERRVRAGPAGNAWRAWRTARRLQRRRRAGGDR